MKKKKRPIKTSPAPRDKSPSKTKKSGKTAMAAVKMALFWIKRLAVQRDERPRKIAKATARVKSITFPLTMSPKESSGMPWSAEMIPTKRFGADAAKATVKKATTNSRQPKNLATLIKTLTSHSRSEERR